MQLHKEVKSQPSYKRKFVAPKGHYMKKDMKPNVVAKKWL